MKLCPKCNLEYNDEFMFCHHCGSELQIKNEQRYCSYCGQLIDNDSDFCPFCGKSLSQKQFVNHTKTSSIKIAPSKQSLLNDYETSALGWFVIVLVYLADLITGLVIYHIARMVRRKAVFDSLGLRYSGNEFSSGELFLAIVVGYSIFFASWYFVKKINAKAAKYLLDIVIVGIVTIPLIGCIFGLAISGILFWVYLAWCIYRYKNRQ